MAHGIGAYLGNAWMNALGNATAFSVAVPYVKLHVGDPGAAGTANPAVETTRKSVSFGVFFIRSLSDSSLIDAISSISLSKCFIAFSFFILYI